VGVSKLKTLKSTNQITFFDTAYVGMVFLYSIYLSFSKVKDIAKSNGYKIKKIGNRKIKIIDEIETRSRYDDDDDYSSSFMSTSSVFSGGSSSFGSFSRFGGGSFGGGGGGF